MSAVRAWSIKATITLVRKEFYVVAFRSERANETLAAAIGTIACNKRLEIVAFFIRKNEERRYIYALALRVKARATTGR